MSFSLIRPAGFITGTRLLASELQTWQTDFVNAIDGAGGGSYTLTAGLSISGDVVTLEDLTVTADVTLGTSGTDTLTVNSAATFNDDVTLGSGPTDALTVAATSTFTGSAEFQALTTISGNLSCTGAAIGIGDSDSDVMTVTATANFLNGVTLGSSGSDSLTINAASTIAGSATFNSTVETNSNIDFKGTTALYDVALYYRDNSDSTYLKLLDSDTSDDIEFGNAANDIYVLANGMIAPYSDDTISCGGASNKFTAVYATNGTIQTSDETLKSEFSDVPDVLLDAWDNRSPGLYRWLHGNEKTHAGWGAQSLAAAFTEAGLEPKQFGLFDVYEANGETRWGLNYSECQAIENLSLRRKIAMLEDRLSDLESKLA